jgi:hypothetical protein
MEPSANNYDKYIAMIKDYSLTHPNEEVLSIQTFACHGIVAAGSQRVLINKMDEVSKYY